LIRRIFQNMLTCAISGETPSEPVVSTKTGHIFEKRLILKALEGVPKCPVTDQDLSPAELIPVQTLNKPVQPRPPSATSISSLLKIFQDEWDQLLLESYKLKKHVSAIRQELSHALYQHDAACRVIARVTQERDKARSELAEMKKNMKAALDKSQADEAMDVEPQGFSDELVAKIKQKKDELYKWRRSRNKKPAGLTTKQQFGQFKEVYTETLHSPSESGILSVALNPHDSDIVFTGGVDSQILCWNRKKGKKVTSLTKHSKKIQVLRAHKEHPILLSGSSDKTVGIWSKTDKWSLSHQMDCHSGAVVDIDLHPLSEYFVSSSDDGSWAFSNLIRGEVVQRVPSDGSLKLTAIRFHPDGQLMGTGDSNNDIKIWDFHKQTLIVTLDQSTGPITSLSFSENGYHLAAGSTDGHVRIYDLRKTSLLHTFDNFGGPINKVCYDKTGQYLAAAASSVQVFQSRYWNTLASLTTHTKEVTDLAWGPNANFLATVSKDRSLKYFSFQDLE